MVLCVHISGICVLQTHSNERENTKVRIKGTVMLKDKMNIFMDESTNTKHMMVRRLKLWTFGILGLEKGRENQELNS